MKYQDKNAQTIDSWVIKGWQWGKPITHEEYLSAKEGKWEVYLSPTKPMPHSWIGDIQNKKILGLASGGAQQMPVFAALGGIVTVLDYSTKQLESEMLVSKRENYVIEIIRADMTEPLPFDDESFDIVFHPVSNCYVEEVKPIFKECYRILKKGGILLCGLDNGFEYIFDEAEEKVINYLPFNPLKDKNQMKQLEECDGGVQFSHTLEEQIGGQLEAGFILTDLYEDTNGSGNLHEKTSLPLL